MTEDVMEYLSAIPPFSSLNKADLKHLVPHISYKTIQKNQVVGKQGKTPITEILVIQSGMLEMYFEIDQKKILAGTLEPGNIYGGISLLMNNGVCIRTVQATKTVRALAVDKSAFSELCRRRPAFYQYFTDTFNERMRDESYTALFSANRTYRFLSDLMPFSLLPEEELEQVSGKLTTVLYPKNTLLFLQGKSELKDLYIIQKGAAERYFEEKGKKKLKGILGEGELFGGISILLNDFVAVRSLKTVEDTYFYLLPRKLFLSLSRKYRVFSEYFTDAFGQRMLDRSYAAIITKSGQPLVGGAQFFNQPVTAVYQPGLISCATDSSIRNSAKIMTEKGVSSIFVCDENGDPIGIVTDADFRKKIIAKGGDIRRPIRDIMSVPLQTISGRALIFEALMKMMKQNVKHLAVRDLDDNIVGMVTSRDILTAQGHSPVFLMREIHAARNMTELTDKHNQLPNQIQNLIITGAKSRNITRLITTVSDAILTRIIEFAIEKHGPPPCSYAFMIMGSEGRMEQTLKTDQDNAIVFEDVPEGDTGSVEAYFLKFGETVCEWLNDAGYTFCSGGIMAKNPKWCKPISVWKRYFFKWIHEATPEDLLRASIFFDFRLGWGEKQLVDELKRYLVSSLSGWAGFLRNLTENALHFKPPIGFFRNFVVESRGEHKDAFDIKHAMLPVVDFARIYALKHGIDETNTIERLHQVYLQNGLKYREYHELEQAYGFMMQLRFARQITAMIEENRLPDNYIKPKELSGVEQTTLKEIFKRVVKYQDKLSFDFLGV